MPVQPRITLRQIAAHAGVSVQTVGFVLGGKAHLFRPEMQARVLASARVLGYRRNSAARAVVTGRFDCVSVVVSAEEARSSFFGDRLLEGIHDALARRDMHLTLTRVAEERLAKDGQAPKALREALVDGLLINYFADIPPRLRELIAGCGLPAVWVNSKQPADCVHPDDQAAAREATRWLLALGHRRVAYVDCTYEYDRHGHARHYSGRDRTCGYAAAMRAARAKPQLLRAGRWIPPAERVAWMRNWLAATPRPTAVVTYLPGEALPLAYAALSLGLRVPEDLSILTFSNAERDDSGLELTRMVAPFHEVGGQAVELLVRKIAQPKLALPPRALAFALVEGRTVGPAPRRGT